MKINSQIWISIFIVHLRSTGMKPMIIFEYYWDNNLYDTVWSLRFWSFRHCIMPIFLIDSCHCEYISALTTLDFINIVCSFFPSSTPEIETSDHSGGLELTSTVRLLCIKLLRQGFFIESSYLMFQKVFRKISTICWKVLCLSLSYKLRQMVLAISFG